MSFSTLKLGWIGLNTNSAFCKFAVVNGFVVGTWKLNGCSEMSLHNFSNLGCMYSWINSFVSAGKLSSSLFKIVSHIPWNGEFLFKYFVISLDCSFLTNCNKFWSSSFASTGMINFWVSIFSTLPTKAVPSSLTSPLITLNDRYGYSLVICCITKPNLSNVFAIFCSLLPSSSISQSFDLGIFRMVDTEVPFTFWIRSSKTFKKGFPSW